MSELPEYKLDRIFDAPRNMVWRAWTDPDLLQRWMGDKTNVRLSQVPMEATDAEIACFAAMMGGMDKGWGSGYTIMDEMFVELQSENQ